MGEIKIEKRCRDYAIAKSWLAYKFTSPGNIGVPDRIFIKAGKVLFVEFKAPGETSTPLQTLQQNYLIQEQMHVYEIDSFDEFKMMLNNWESYFQIMGLGENA